ncbi:aldo/keto reductase [Candidatus Contubernalis alkaliaceticus]|uniref:aldo/keto reductase n=1 Tax=Candidatus Contubernalis alkaliaceticus TaxID=338645 RepID=UPI001F4BD146|nr:aldo/keto reductase [Candidatus Contubernalis alkalaceticus]UNC92590.1 aldo/keto reductase [Candidatus Contubernalis alkalaceticus]
MNYCDLGKTGITVSRLCFGTLTIGPLQARLSIEKGASLLVDAFENGINFFDTAEIYKNYDYLCSAFKNMNPKPVVATKSYAYTKENMEKSLSKALREMGLEAVDIFLLHEQESENTIKGHFEALEYLLRAKEKGYVRAVGISCHTTAAVEAALKYPEIEIIHPLVNFRGIGIRDGTVEQMLSLLKKAAEKNIGIYAMKPLGGGHLIKQAEKAFNFVLSHSFIHSVAVGMQSGEELLFNQAVFSDTLVPEDLRNQLMAKPRRIVVESWCKGCGECISHCPQGALTIKDNKAQVRKSDCIFCGYCGVYCEDICIKIY